MRSFLHCESSPTNSSGRFGRKGPLRRHHRADVSSVAENRNAKRRRPGWAWWDAEYPLPRGVSEIIGELIAAGAGDHGRQDSNVHSNLQKANGPVRESRMRPVGVK